MGRCISGSRTSIWPTIESVLRTERGLCPRTPGVYRLCRPQQSAKKKAVPPKRQSLLLYVWPLGARVALLRSPVFPKAKALYLLRRLTVQDLIIPGRSSAYLAQGPSGHFY